MATYFVSRHPGAVEWAAQHTELDITNVLSHLDPGVIDAGDTVIGVLPVALASEVCARGGRFLNLTLRVPPALRGKELSAEQMVSLGCSIREFIVTEVDVQI